MLWAGGSALRLLPPYVLPAPWEVFSPFFVPFLGEVVITLIRGLIGLAMAVLITYALTCAALAGGKLDRLEPHLASIRAIPSVAAMPLLIIWFGFSEWARIVIVCATGTAYLMPPLVESVRDLPREWTLLRKREGLTVLRYFGSVVSFATLPNMRGAMRIAWAICLTSAVAVDYMGSTVGAGRVIESARVTFNVPLIVFVLFSLGAFGIAVDWLIAVSLRKITMWHGQTAKA